MNCCEAWCHSPYPSTLMLTALRWSTYPSTYLCTYLTEVMWSTMPVLCPVINILSLVVDNSEFLGLRYRWWRIPDFCWHSKQPWRRDGCQIWCVYCSTGMYNIYIYTYTHIHIFIVYCLYHILYIVMISRLVLTCSQSTSAHTTWRRDFSHFGNHHSLSS